METLEPVDMLLSIFKALADENRLRLLGVLAQGPQTVEQLAEIIQLRPSTTSHHLARLVDVGLVRARPEGYYNIYSLEPHALDRLAQTLLAKDALVRQAVSLDLEAFDRKVVADFSLPDGRLKTIPAQRKKLEAVLRRLVQEFEPGVEYTEAEVNQILGRFHPDTASLRREMIGYELLGRDKKGSRYWRLAPLPGQSRDAGGLASGSDADGSSETGRREPAAPEIRSSQKKNMQ
jgi:hypothetical protein